MNQEKQLKQYCKILKEARIKANLSKMDVFRAVGVRWSALTQIEENGNPQLLTMIKLCDLYGLKLEIHG